MSSVKQLCVLAGGNGVGKTTFYEYYLKTRGLQFVNADIFAERLGSEKPEYLGYQAAILVGKLRTSLLKKGVSFCYETVFSHTSKIDFIAHAKELGYEIILYYIHVNEVDINISRVASRVSQGGHNVPTEKIISRIPRTMKNIRVALPLADFTYIFDNSFSDEPFINVANIIQGDFQQHIDPLPDWALTLLEDYRR